MKQIVFLAELKKLFEKPTTLNYIICTVYLLVDLLTNECSRKLIATIGTFEN